MTPEFWKKKKLSELTAKQWEALCDGCGLCCLEKFEDRSSGEVFYTALGCPYLDISHCRCLVYADRRRMNPDCIDLAGGNLQQLRILPGTCAYRLVAAGEDLPPWHHLVCGDRNAVHRSGISVQNKAVCGRYVDPLDKPAPVLFRISKHSP